MRPARVLFTPAARLASALPDLVPPLCFLALLLFPALCFAQGVHHPFAVGVNEGAASPANGFSAWILAQESSFYRLLSGAIKAAQQNGTAAWGLVALSLAYGVFHAAGPGHGKAVIASYMFANERALRRGIAIAFGAAVLQGFSAITVVGISAVIVKATAQNMRAAINAVEIASYAGIVLLGALLLYAKGAALLGALRSAPLIAVPAGVPHPAAVPAVCSSDHAHGPGCGHAHAPDPRSLLSSFSWKTAILTAITAGLRPCSGAILVLVFALAQGIFPAGVFSVAAMSLGTALTTAGLASAAVSLKRLSVKYSKPGSHRLLIAGRVFEFLAAAAVLALGLVLLAAALQNAGGAP